MSSSEGLYYAAMDADTDGEEGKYYSYEMDELKMISENTDFDLFLSYYNIDVENPWEKNRFLLLPNKFNYEKKWMDSNNISKKEISDLITIWEKNIINIKEDRTKPRIDDKIIISWNALAIIGLIDAYDAFKKQDI